MRRSWEMPAAPHMHRLGAEWPLFPLSRGPQLNASVLKIWPAATRRFQAQQSQPNGQLEPGSDGARTDLVVSYSPRWDGPRIMSEFPAPLRKVPHARLGVAIASCLISQRWSRLGQQSHVTGPGVRYEYAAVAKVGSQYGEKAVSRKKQSLKALPNGKGSSSTAHGVKPSGSERAAATSARWDGDCNNAPGVARDQRGLGAHHHHTTTAVALVHMGVLWGRPTPLTTPA